MGSRPHPLPPTLSDSKSWLHTYSITHRFEMVLLNLTKIPLEYTILNALSPKFQLALYISIDCAVWQQLAQTCKEPTGDAMSQWEKGRNLGINNQSQRVLCPIWLSVHTNALAGLRELHIFPFDNILLWAYYVPDLGIFKHLRRAHNLVGNIAVSITQRDDGTTEKTRPREWSTRQKPGDNCVTGNSHST